MDGAISTGTEFILRNRKYVTPLLFAQLGWQSLGNVRRLDAHVHRSRGADAERDKAFNMDAVTGTADCTYFCSPGK